MSRGPGSKGKRRREARLSLRWRIVLWVGCAQLVVLLLSAWLLLDNARQAIAEESHASQALARRYVIATVGSLLRAHDPRQAMALLPDQLQQPRHVRLHVIDGRDQVIPPLSGSAGEMPATSPAPGWFTWLLHPKPEVTRVPVAIDGTYHGSVVITSAPGDEIAEAWADFRDVTSLTAAGHFLLLMALLVALERSLRPLAAISGAIGLLRDGDYRVRLPAVSIPDFRPLVEGFNGLAAALQQALADKDRLNQRLITVQDSERKQLASELHDEFGPCLFGIKVEAQAIAEDLRRSKGADRDHAMAEAVERARSIGTIVEQMQQKNRALLTRLRPMALGQLPLAQVLDDLVGGLAAHGPDADWQVSIDPSLGGFDETTELTVYRVVQEAVTNALRHAGARRLEVRVARDGPDRLAVEVSDDGRGIAPDRPTGLGLRSMRERVEGLGGRFVVSAAPDGGTRLLAEVPLCFPPTAMSEREAQAAGGTGPAELPA